MATTDSSATPPPSTEEQIPHGCIAPLGVVYIGQLLDDPETGDELETFEAVPCRRCSESH